MDDMVTALSLTSPPPPFVDALPLPPRECWRVSIRNHEDRDMMRPIVIMPIQLDPFMS
jgi:hypothetical protein